MNFAFCIYKNESSARNDEMCIKNGSLHAKREALLHPDVTTQSLVPVASEIKLWADSYAMFFGDSVSLPLNFPIIAVRFYIKMKILQ